MNNRKQKLNFMKKVFFIKLTKRSQIALEFLLVMSITMVMLFPTMSLFSNFVTESTKEVINVQIDYVGKSMIDTAQQMYYYGNSSMTIVEYKFPQRIKEMRINSNPKTNYYEIAFTIELPGGEITKAYPSPIPITNLYPEGLFPNESFTAGIKHFRIENIGPAINIITSPAGKWNEE